VQGDKLVTVFNLTQNKLVPRSQYSMIDTYEKVSANQQTNKPVNNWERDNKEQRDLS
jgi:hypothetical protein